MQLGHRAGGDLVDPVAAAGQRGARRVRFRVQGAAQLGVLRVDVEVVHIHQQAAAGALRQRGEKFGFWHVGVGPAQVGRQVFDGDGPLEALLHPLHVGDHHGQRLAGEGHGQQISRVNRGAAGHERPARKAGVVAHAHRVDFFDQPGQLRQMPVVHPAGRAQRQAHAVQADGVVFAALAQHGQGRAAGGEEIFGMDFDEVQRRAGLQQLGVMRVPPSDAHRRQEGQREGGQRHGGISPSSWRRP